MFNVTSVQHARHSKCEVCDCAITYPDSLIMKDVGYSVCRSFFCKKIMSQKSSMTPFLFKYHLDFNKNIVRQRHEKAAARKKHIDEVTEKERQENREILQSILNDKSELSEDNLYLLAIPSGYSKSVPSMNKRVNKYIEHLNKIVSEAGGYSNVSEVTYDEHQKAHGKKMLVEQRFVGNPSLRTISDRLCCMCKGGCCVKGKEHAYISVFTIRRYMDDNPDLSAEDILGCYLPCISSEVIENSCINHTKTGCALPRQLRSDICNGYYCDSLESYQKKMSGRENSWTVLVVQRSCTNWNKFEPGTSNEIVDVALVGKDCNEGFDSLSSSLNRSRVGACWT